MDPSGLFNICSKLSNLTYLRLKYEANQSLKLLSDELNQIDKFDALFLKASQLHLTFDALFEYGFFAWPVVVKVPSRSEPFHLAGSTRASPRCRPIAKRS